jgi:cytochrome c oxidase subunit IV
MNEPHRTYDQQQHVESHAPYIKIWIILLVFTVAEWLYATYASVGFFLLVLGLMTMALTKAALVGLYFMHLKFEGRWVYAFLIPAGILATIFVLALYPDIGTQQPGVEPSADEEAAVAPASPGSVAVV